MTEILRYPALKHYGLPFLGGLLYASAFPFYKDQTFIMGGILGMLLLCLNFGYESYNAPRFKRELLGVLCFSLGHYLFGHYWIAHTLEVFGGLAFPFNHLLGLFFSLVILPHFIIFTLINALIRKLSLNSWSFVSGVTRRNILYAFLFTFLEYFIPQQFPAHLGHTWLPLAPNLGLAPYLGAPAFSFFSYLLVLSLVSLIKRRKIDVLALVFVAIFGSLNFFMPLKSYPESAQQLNIRMVQANIGNYLKLSSEAGKPQALSEVLSVFEQLSTSPFKDDKDIDLIIWPETAYPRLLSSASMKGTSLFTPFLISETLEQSNAEIFFGGYDQVPQRSHHSYFETEYNAAFFLTSSGNLKNVYHKQILIPFGENLPFGPFNEFLSQYLKNISFFAKGNDFTSFKTESGWPFITAICYEILFSSYIRDYLNAQQTPPSFLINLTNDSWYGDTSEPYQHLFLTKWRALEFNLPILRMTNTGITSTLFPDGTESERLLPFTKGNLDIVLDLHKGRPTYFQRYGFWSLPLIALGLMIVSFLFDLTLRRLRSLP